MGLAAACVRPASGLPARRLSGPGPAGRTSSSRSQRIGERYVRGSGTIVLQRTMGTLAEQLVRLRRYNAAVQKNDRELAEETRDKGYEEEVFTEGVAAEDIERQIAEETIVMRRERPVLVINENVTQLIFIDKADSEIWDERLRKARPLLEGHPDSRPHRPDRRPARVGRQGLARRRKYHRDQPPWRANSRRAAARASPSRWAALGRFPRRSTSFRRSRTRTSSRSGS
jgi:hypothetical protein